MKTQFKDILELGKLVNLVETEGTKNSQYSRELINYIDMLHKRISSLEMHMGHIFEVSKQYT